ncbi:MAG: hypothetical protein CVU05_09340 [Bacteroidetes bacterium HGW-Bacteroidetes-21]|jgi:hypothetical protein|nr:MAG: hypothetical protein CVU05_09340 [Bacteroidetes bacterium HGW-Bacteroidetes-21]
MKTKKLLILTQNQNNMKRLFLISAILICYTLANAQNPFEAYGYTPKIATLSQGKYNEFHDLDTIVQIGTVLFNTKSKQIVAFLQTDTLYSEATLQPDIVSMWMSPDPLSDEYPSNSPYMYCLGNPIVLIDPDGRYVDWYLSLKSGQVEHHDGSDNLFDQGLVHLAPDNASVGDIQDALSQRNYSYQKDPSVPGGFRVDTEKQYKGWTMMQYYSPDIVGTILFMSLGTGGTTEQVGKTAARSAIANVTKTSTTVLKGAVKNNYSRFVSKIPANSKSNASFQLLDDGNYLFQATSPGKVPGSSALYQKWVNSQGETFKMIKTTFAPDGSIIHVKPKY